MSWIHKIFLILISLTVKSALIEARCGHPELPYMAVDFDAKAFYETNETVKIGCFNGVLIGPNQINENNGTVKCLNSNWDRTNWRCSQLYNFSALNITINGREQTDQKLNEYEFASLNDNNPVTCVTLRDEEEWVFNLNQFKLVTHVAMIAAFLNEANNKTIEIEVLAGQEICLKDKLLSGDRMVNTFLLYKCNYDEPTDNITIHLQTNGNDINICGVDIFAINSARCGKPEAPLYSYTNIMEIQNGSRIVEYICANGYTLKGRPTRTCGVDGLWMPAQVPSCVPQVECELFSDGNYSYKYEGLDHFGSALPGIALVRYECLNETDQMSRPVERICLKNGHWSAISGAMPYCHRRHVITMFGHHLTNDKNLVVCGGAAVSLLFLFSLVILLHSRRLAKRISRQMRENTYKQQTKSLPNYNSEANYSDITVWAQEQQEQEEAMVKY